MCPVGSKPPASTAFKTQSGMSLKKRSASRELDLFGALTIARILDLFVDRVDQLLDLFDQIALLAPRRRALVAVAQTPLPPSLSAGGSEKLFPLLPSFPHINRRRAP